MAILNLLKEIYRSKNTNYTCFQEVKAVQDKRFKNLLVHVLNKSDFYKNHYKKHGITLSNVTKASLQDLPPINKKLMMEHFDTFVCDKELKRSELEDFLNKSSSKIKKYKNKYQVIHTSGSTGTIGIFVYGPREWNILKALVITRVTKNSFQMLNRVRLAYIGAADGNFAGFSLAKDAPRILFNFLPLSINSPLKETLEKINRFQPDSLSGYSSGVYLLALEQLQGTININPKRIICSADPLSSNMNKTIKKAFGIYPINFYAASESIGMGAMCDADQGFHLFTDWHIFELVDENFDYVKPNEVGKLILTNLYNYTQPLIRYQMNDELALNEINGCKCGSSFPLIKKISGRQEDFIWFERPNGLKDFLHPIVLIEFFVPGLKKFQFVQTEKNKLLIKAKINGDTETIMEAIHRRMAEILKEKSLEKIVGLNVEIVDEIRNDPKTGKFKLIIPLK